MRVLLGTDGSDSAALAAELVGNIRWPIGTSIDAVRVLEERVRDVVSGPWPAIGLAEDPQLGRDAIRDAEDALVALFEPLRKSGLKTDHALLRGRAADALLDWIHGHRPDIVIVGNRGVSTLERTLVGSVSAELVDGSPVPVLVARRPTLERVVVAVDGSDIAAQAVATVQRWAFLGATEIRTLSVTPAAGAWWPGDLLTGSTATAALEHGGTGVDEREHGAVAMEAAAALRAVGFKADAEVLVGSPASTIVAFASEWDADLVILGSHGRTGLARLLLGSVARSVLHHAGCSVVIVRRHADLERARSDDAAVRRPWTILATH